MGTTDNVVSLLTFPSLETVSSPISLTSELVDLAWGGRKGEWVSLDVRVVELTRTAIHCHDQLFAPLPRNSHREGRQAGPQADDISTQYRYIARRIPSCKVSSFIAGDLRKLTRQVLPNNPRHKTHHPCGAQFLFST